MSSDPEKGPYPFFGAAEIEKGVRPLFTRAFGLRIALWYATLFIMGSLRLVDGTLVQVGKSTEAREDLLARFRAVLGIVTLSIVAIALTGGFLVTRSAVVPIRRLTQAVRRIIRTGRTDARVPLPPGS